MIPLIRIALTTIVGNSVKCHNVNYGADDHRTIRIAFPQNLGRFPFLSENVRNGSLPFTRYLRLYHAYTVKRHPAKVKLSLPAILILANHRGADLRSAGWRGLWPCVESETRQAHYAGIVAGLTATVVLCPPGLSVKFFPRSCGWQSIAVNLAPVADDTNNDLF